MWYRSRLPVKRLQSFPPFGKRRSEQELFPSAAQSITSWRTGSRAASAAEAATSGASDSASAASLEAALKPHVASAFQLQRSPSTSVVLVPQGLRLTSPFVTQRQPQNSLPGSNSSSSVSEPESSRNHASPASQQLPNTASPGDRVQSLPQAVKPNGETIRIELSRTQPRVSLVGMIPNSLVGNV